jgi:hypothetical protein
MVLDLFDGIFSKGNSRFSFAYAFFLLCLYLPLRELVVFSEAYAL